jgi:hypothetical protein
VIIPATGVDGSWEVRFEQSTEGIHIRLVRRKALVKLWTKNGMRQSTKSRCTKNEQTITVNTRLLFPLVSF